MSVFPVIRSVLLVLALSLVADPAAPADGENAPPVSLDRIRAALARPPALDLSAATPPVHFHVEVQGRRFYRDIPPIWATRPRLKWTPPPWSPSQTSPALFQVDLLGLGRPVASAVSGARRARAVRDAREEVEDARREFCAERECEAR